jgi:transglutaminase-like putative cysteine protease
MRASLLRCASAAVCLLVFSGMSTRLLHAQGVDGASSAPQGVVQQDSSEERWFALERLGVRVGWRHVRIERLGGGYREARSEELRRGRLPGGARADMRIVQRCMVDSSWTVISLTADTEWRGHRLRLQGANDRGTLHAAFEHPDGRVDRRREIVRGSVPDLFLADAIPALAAQLRATGEMTVLDTRAAVPVLLPVSVSADGPLRVRLGRRSELFFDENGALTRQQDMADDIVLIPADADVQKDTATFELPLLEHWSFASADRITEPDNVRLARLILRFERGLPADLSMEDLRQHAEAPDGQAVTVELRHDEPGDAGITIPVLDPTLLHFLGPTPLVSAHDEGITALAADLRGRNRDAYVIARDILSWVRQSVLYDPFVVDAAADRILDGRRADQRGIAVLLTALLRATGIPARVAAGQKASEEGWSAGVWSEIWLGQWVPADALTGEFITGATHLKFYDSSAPEQLPGGAALPDRRVRLSLVRLQSRDSSAAGSLPTGVYGDAYSNRSWRCVVRAPGDDWELEDRPRGGGAALSMRRRDDSSAVFDLYLFLAGSDRDPQRQLDARMRAQERLCATYSVLEKGRMTLGGLNAPYAVTTARPQRGVQVETTSAHIVMVDGVNGYVCSFQAPASRFAMYKPVLERILRSFRIVRD